MKIGIIIPCRLDSVRLPGKVLMPVQGKALLWYLIARCRQVDLPGDYILVASTDRTIDEPIERFCHTEGITLFRGAVEDVAGRMLACANEAGLDYFVRANADSPFLDPALINKACQVVTRRGYQFVTNLYPRSFPYGVSVELVQTSMFQSAYQQMHKPSHFEHVTQYLYENITQFDYHNITHDGPDLSRLRLTVDTEADFRRFEGILGQLNYHKWPVLSFLDVAKIYQELV